MDKILVIHRFFTRAYEELSATKDEAEEKEDKDYNVNLDNLDDKVDNNFTFKLG